jgi:ATP-dependent RNA/DNA helicase IGHMBP2
LGKSLLELQPNRGDLLPPHKLTPHDVVNLKLNKGDASTPSLGQGIVYRIKDNAIIIAVDDVPEDGLDSPLRLEKLANEVRH